MGKPPPDPIFTFKGTMKCVYSVAFFKRNEKSLLYCGTQAGDVHIWDTNLFREVKKLKVGSEPCISIHFNGCFVTQEKNGPIKMWKEEDNLDWVLQFSFDPDHAAYCRLTLSQDLLFCPYLEGSFKMITERDVEGAAVFKTEKKLGLIMGLRYLEKAETVVAVFEEGSVCTFSKEGGMIGAEKLTTECLMAVDVCESCDFGVVGSSGSELIKFSLEGKPRRLKSVELTNPGVSSVAIRKDGVLFAIGTWDGAIKYFSGKSMKLLAVLTVHTMSVETLAFADDTCGTDSKLLFAGSRDGRVTMWDLYSDR